MCEVQASLGRLTQRVNVMTRYPNDKLVIIYDDHRWLLNVLFKIQKDRLLPGPPKLVFFDSHDDAGQTQKKSELLAHIGVENVLDATEKTFSSFVDYDIRTDDGNWLSVACELNLVSDAVVIGDKYSHNIEAMNGVYTSEDGIEHKLYNLSDNLDFELGCRGSLGDHAREDEFRDIRAFFNFFTLNTNEGPLAWPQHIWQKHFNSFSSGTQMMRNLINKAMVITICREPDYCGSIDGIAGSNYNLQNLDNYFFEGQLGSNLLF